MTTISRLLSGLLLAAVFMAVVACGGTETVVEKVVETVIVTEKGDTVEKIVEVTPTSVPTGFSDIPRSKTLIMAGLGVEHPGAFTDVENFNPHAGGVSRSGLYQAATEGLF